MLNKMNKIVAYLTIPMTILMVYCVFMRYVLHDVPDWGFEIAIFMFGIQILLGGIICHRNNKHVTVDIIKKYLNDKNEKYFFLLTEICVIFVCVIVIYVSISWVHDSFIIQETSMQQTSFNYPIWWFKAMIPMSCILMCVESIRKVITMFRRSDGGK